jgi:phosphoglycerol transferase MdoB-like AlkP superfamily enzyme
LKKLLGKLLPKFIDPYVFLTFIILAVKLHFLIKENAVELFRGVFLLNIFFLLLILAPAYLFTAKPRRIYLLLCDIALTLIILADLLNLRFFGSPISIVTIFQAANLAGLGPSISNLVRYTDLLYIIDILITMGT